MEGEGVHRDADLDALVEPFAAAWAACKDAGYMRRFGCSELDPPPRPSKTSPISFFCVDSRDEGRFLAAAFQNLALIQSALLKQMLDVQQAALPEDGKPIAIQNTQMAHLVSDATTASLLRFAVPSRKGLQVDFEQMEADLATRIKGGLALLDGELTFVAYSGEAFRHNAEFLEPIKKRPEFNEALPSSVEKKITDNKSANHWDALSDLELAISYIARTMPDPSQALADFSRQWDLKEPLYAAELRIGHVVELHNCMEQFEGFRRAVNLEDRFKKELPADVQPKCIAKWKSELAKSGKEALKVLRRLIVRFASGSCSYAIETPIHVIAERLYDKRDDNVIVADWGLTLQHLHAAHNAALQATQ